MTAYGNKTLVTIYKAVWFMKTFTDFLWFSFFLFYSKWHDIGVYSVVLTPEHQDFFHLSITYILLILESVHRQWHKQKDPRIMAPYLLSRLN